MIMPEVNLITNYDQDQDDNSEHDRGEPVSPKPGDGSWPAGEQFPHETSFQ